MIKFLFFNAETMLAFEAEREVMLEIFDFGRNKNQTQENAEEFRDLYQRLLENSIPDDGDAEAIRPAFLTFTYGVHHAPESTAPTMRANLAKENYFVYGLASSSFAFWAGDEEDYDSQLESHLQLGTTVGTA